MCVSKCPITVRAMVTKCIIIGTHTRTAVKPLSTADAGEPGTISKQYMIVWINVMGVNEIYNDIIRYIIYEKGKIPTIEQTSNQ